jgi:hypothetical protein
MLFPSLRASVKVIVAEAPPATVVVASAGKTTVPPAGTR